MLKNELRTVEDVESATQDLGFAMNDFLRKQGWKCSSSNPASIWLWEKLLKDGRTVMVDRDTAIAFTKMAGDQEDEERPADSKHPVVPGWAGSEDFRGSDEGSHYMNSKEGLAHLKPDLAQPVTVALKMDKSNIGGLYISNQVKDVPHLYTVVTGDVWKLMEFHDEGPGPAMVTLENTATKSRISFQQDYLNTAYRYLGHMGKNAQIGAKYQYNGTNYAITQQNEATGCVFVEPDKDTEAEIWVRIDKLGQAPWQILHSEKPDSAK
jgi:hypothetical protein